MIHYGVAVLSVAIMTLIRQSLQPWLGVRSEFIAFLPAVIWSTWYSGIGPGVTALILGELSGDFFFTPPLYQFVRPSASDVAAAALYIAVGLFMIWLIEAQKKAQARISLHAHELEVRQGQLEQEIERRNQAEQMQEKLQRQLLLAQKMESAGRLAAGIAHDFNNLLTIILGFNELAAQEIAENHPASAYLQSAQEAGQRATLLTSQLLTMARTQMIAPSIFCLNDLIVEKIPVLRSLLDAYTALFVTPTSLPCQIKAEPGQILQVLIQIIVYAVDSMPEGGKIEITTENVALTEEDFIEYKGTKAGAYVRLEIRDTGAGMSPEVREHLFEPFFANTRKRNRSGLGLATSYGIVRQSGGFILVNSAPGEGTRFSIYFPCVGEIDAKGTVSPGQDTQEDV